MPLWKRNFAFVWINNFVTAIGMMSILPLLPFFLRARVGLDGVEHERIWTGVLIAAAPLTASIMGPFWGALGDQVGRKWMLVRANAGIALFVGAMGFATDPWTLLALRLGQGLFSGFIPPGLTLVSVSAPVEGQGKIAAFLHTGVLCGSAVGPIVGGWIADVAGHEWSFWFCSALSATCALTMALAIIEPPRERSVAASTPGLWALVQGVWSQVRSLVGAGPFRVILVSLLAIRVGQYLAEPMTSLYVEHIAGGTERLGALSGFVVGAMPIATLLATPLVGHFGDRIGHGRMLASAALGAAVLYALQAGVTHVAQLYVLRLAAGVCLAGVLPSAYALASRYSTAEGRGGAYGITFSSLGLAMAVGPVLGGALGALTHLRALYLAAGALMLVAFIGLTRARRRDPALA